MRAVSVGAVVLAHAGAAGPFTYAGGVGVTVFFVLSGFLITSLMFEECESTGRVSRRGFYLRRARRLLPALPAVLLVAALVNMRFGLSIGRELAGAVTYTSNLWQPEGVGGAFRHLWSLAVEEQFYLVWPVVFVWSRPRWWLVAAAVLAVSRFVWVDASTADLAYRLTRWDALLAGCLLAVVWRHGRRVPWHAAAWGLLVLAALSPDMAWFMRTGTLLATVGAVLLVARQVESPSRWLTHPALLHVGRISYGLYLWHYPIAKLLRGYDPTVKLVLCAAVTFAAAQLSYSLVEARFTRRAVLASTPVP